MINNTDDFLRNPGPEPSEPAAVEAPEQFYAETLLFCLPTTGFLLNPGPEPSEPAAVEASELPWRPGAGAGALFAGLGLCAVAHDFSRALKLWKLSVMIVFHAPMVILQF